jgi:hypothetical protein
MREITVNGTDVTEGVRALLENVDWDEFFDRTDDEDADAVVELAHLADFSDASYVAYVIDRRRQEAAEAQRRRDEWARSEAQRQADRAKAAAQLAAEMREREPGLVRAGWTDAQLVELRRMRNAGIA